MKKIIIGLIVLTYVLVGSWGVSTSFAAISGKAFSIVYSSDERGAITPCG